MSRGCILLAGAVGLLCGSATNLPAAQTQVWTADAADLFDGSAESVAVTHRARLFLAPRLTRLGSAGPAGAAYGWAVASDARGNVFAGTGSDGSVLRWAPGAESSLYFAAPEPMVTALLLLPGGDLLAATAPGGKIYRIAPGGRAEVWCETGERYVWALSAAANGTIYAATGERGVLLRIDRNGKADPVFDSDEPHLTALLVLGDGTLVAGSAGSGLVFRIAVTGKVDVWYDGDLSEVADLAAAPDGSVLAGFLAAPDSDPRPPAVRIQIPQGGARASTDAMSSMDDRSPPTLEGVIEGLPASAERGTTRRPRGRVVRILPSGAARELWRSSSEAVFAVAIDHAGRPVFGTGEPARLYRIGDADEVERLANLSAGQVTALLTGEDRTVVITSNPASAYLLESTAAGSGSFVSEPIDADAPAHWGPLVWTTTPAPAAPGLVVQLRTGNSSQPDGTWSDWTQASSASDPAHAVPDGRFLQWRARFSGPVDPALRCERFALSYTPYNRPPLIDSFRIDGRKSSFSDKVSFRWNATDPDGDPVVTEIQYRAVGAKEWQLALRVEPPGNGTEEPSDSTESDGKGTWEVSSIDEGPYEVRVLVSDAPSNRAGEGFEEPSPRILRLILDRTPPKVRAHRTADGNLSVEGEDSLSSVGCLEVTEDGRAIRTILAADGVCDGRRESFVVRPEDTGLADHRSIRLGDAAGNSTLVGIPGR